MTPASYEILPGLPPYGPVAEAFSTTGKGTHGEGFVVRFTLHDRTTWVGNFQPSLGSLSGVFVHPDGKHFLVISKGEGYIVDPLDRNYRDYIGVKIEEVILIPQIPALVVSDGLLLEAYGTTGLCWVTNRLSWDGIQNIQINFPKLTGEAWSPLNDEWAPFEVNLLTGKNFGGSYQR